MTPAEELRAAATAARLLGGAVLTDRETDVLVAVAAWLEQAAERHHEDEAGLHYMLCRSGHWEGATQHATGQWRPELCPDMVAALAVARAIGGQT